jgi:hypothetical protein
VSVIFERSDFYLSHALWPGASGFPPFWRYPGLTQGLASDPERRRSGFLRAAVKGMMWRRPRLPAQPKIADFGFEAFDLKPQRPAGGEDKLHNARGRLGFLEADIQEIENERLVSTMKAQARDLENTPEMQARPAALAARASHFFRRGPHPIEPRRDHRELFRLRQKGHLADTHQGVLKICRDHREIVGVEGDQSGKIRHRRLSTFACDWPLIRAQNRSGAGRTFNELGRIWAFSSTKQRIEAKNCTCILPKDTFSRAGWRARRAAQK